MCRKLFCFVSLVLVLDLVLTSAANANLIGWWRFDDDFLDSSGLGNDGIPEGNPTFVEGYTGFGLELDGDDFVVIDAVADDFTDTDITLSAWVKTSDSGADWFSCNTSSRGNQVRLAIEGGKFGFDTDSEHALSTTTVSDGEWHLLTFVRSGNIGYTYVDGVMENSYDAAANNTGDFIPSDLWSIGQEWDSGGPSGHLTGIVDDVRIYDRALLEAEILVIMEGGEGYPYALGPKPADGAFIEDTWVNMSWRAGDFAVSHDLYLGENFDDVNDGTGDTFRGNQSTTDFIIGFPGFPFPDGLVPGTTYYWRIDEVNDTEPNSPWKGDVWSFSIPPKTAYNPDPAEGAEFVDPNAAFSWTGGFGAKLHTVYIGTNFDDVNNAAGGAPMGVASYNPGPLELEKVYYWRVDEFDPPFTHKGDVWSFTTPGAVGNPQPANGAVDVQMIATLSWTPADNAASHELYFGTDADAVKNATTASPEYIGPKALGAESYDPGGLAWDSSYAWRVDEVYPAETVKGLVWSFATADFILVDDFESYNDIDPPDPNSNRIFEAWIDGFGTTDNGALVGNEMPPYAEQTVVHGGIQSMPYFYDNANKTSEATLTLVYPRDWTEEGVAKLSLWFRGSSSNAADRMYVALNGTALVYHADDAATQTSGWTQWVIDLSAFAGVDLTNVNSITIGIGTKNSPAPAGGTGTMYFDDIRLVR
ncbi:MAG: LamG domain-containing protein [Planctomycetota bacterium]|jgi:hypothetical protein